MVCADLSALREFNSLAAAKILAGKGLLRFQELWICSLENDLAARGAMSGAEVHDLLGGADHTGFVFNHDDGVAREAKLQEQADKAFGVTRVQADTRFVQDEERIDQAGAETGGEVDALGLAAGERARRTVQGEIAQADLVEITEP